MSIRTLCKNTKDIIPYLFFGICTTMINVVSYWCIAHLMKVSVMPSTIAAWCLSVLFAYVTNRKWVFHSKSKGIKEISYEMFSFFVCRLATGLVDWLCMFVFVTLAGLNDVFIKAVANVLVIILNYVASKLVIFRK